MGHWTDVQNYTTTVKTTHLAVLAIAVILMFFLRDDVGLTVDESLQQGGLLVAMMIFWMMLNRQIYFPDKRENHPYLTVGIFFMILGFTCYLSKLHFLGTTLFTLAVYKLVVAGIISQGTLGKRIYLDVIIITLFALLLCIVSAVVVKQYFFLSGYLLVASITTMIISRGKATYD